MFRPAGFADLRDRRVGIFGYGIEGRATRRRLATLTNDLIVVDDQPSEEGVLASTEGGLAALATCDVVLKSPGIPRRRADVVALEELGVVVTSALDLWLRDVDRRRVIAVTGTKGKSTTTSLVAFFLCCLGEKSHELGNFGQPPYDPDLDLSAGWLVLEVSSFQSVDVSVAPSLVLVTSLGSDHLDWHGTLERYHEDKLAITRASGEHLTLIAATIDTQQTCAYLGGEVQVAAADTTGLAQALGLLGAHNDDNVGLALVACSHATRKPVDVVRAAVSERAGDFVPLRGRLTLIATLRARSGQVRFVDDGLATAPLPSIAALNVFAGEPLALIAGGFDRGVDYTPLALALRQRGPDTMVVVMGPAGDRIAALLGDAVQHRRASDMASAVRSAHSALARGGVVLFSPGAPSFDAYRNWSDRCDAFASAVQDLEEPEEPSKT